MVELSFHFPMPRPPAQQPRRARRASASRPCWATSRFGLCLIRKVRWPFASLNTTFRMAFLELASPHAIFELPTIQPRSQSRRCVTVCQCETVPARADAVPSCIDSRRVSLRLITGVLIDLEEELPVRRFVPSNDPSIIPSVLPHFETVPTKGPRKGAKLH